MTSQFLPMQQNNMGRSTGYAQTNLGNTAPQQQFLVGIDSNGNFVPVNTQFSVGNLFYMENVNKLQQLGSGQ